MAFVYCHSSPLPPPPQHAYKLSCSAHHVYIRAQEETGGGPFFQVGMYIDAISLKCRRQSRSFNILFVPGSFHGRFFFKGCEEAITFIVTYLKVKREAFVNLFLRLILIQPAIKIAIWFFYLKHAR